MDATFWRGIPFTPSSRFALALGHLVGSTTLAFQLAWDGGAICIDKDETWRETALVSGDVPQLALTLSVQAAEPHKPFAASTPNAQTTAVTIAALNAFAMRITVPATEASRAGAGSTLSDND